MKQRQYGAQPGVASVFTPFQLRCCYRCFLAMVVDKGIKDLQHFFQAKHVHTYLKVASMLL